MSHDKGGLNLPGISAFEVNELLPKFDCGLCGNPLCMTLARRVLIKAQDPGDCMFISKDNIVKIEDKMVKVSPTKKERSREGSTEGIIEIFPCTEDGKVTLEVMLSSGHMGLFNDYFDEYQLCTSLSEAEMLEKINCSPKMGYALVEMGGKRAHIFKTGKIIMRRADSSEDALDTLGMLSKLLLPARICQCGNVLADCYGGGCGSGTEEGSLIDTKHILDLDEDQSNERLSENYTTLSILINELHSIDNQIKEGGLEKKGALQERIHNLVTQVNENSIQVVYTDRGTSDTILALIQYGLARDLARAGSGLISISTTPANGLYDQAASILFDAFDAYGTKNVEASRAILNRYEEFVSHWREASAPMGIAKIATNGFYISRVLAGFVPDVMFTDYTEDKGRSGR